MSSGRMVFMTLLSALLISSAAQAGPKDRTQPTVAITSPTSGMTYTTAQTVIITASASDNYGVSRVEFYRNSVWQGTDTSAPYSYAWAITSANNGSHSWTARAYDAAGNNATSSAVSLRVNISPSTTDTTAPTVPTGLTAHATSCSQITLSWKASTDSGGSGLKGYNVYRSGAWLKQVATTTTTDPGLAAATVYRYTVTAVDQAGNQSAPSTAAATNTPACTDTLAPTVALTSPAAGTTYTTAQTVTVTATATDNVGVSQVAFYRNGLWQGSDSIAPYTYAWALTAAHNGSQTWTAKAYDTAGNVGSASPVTVTVSLASSSGGAHVWSRPFGGTGADRGQGLAVAASGQVAMAGFYANTVNLGNGGLPCTSTRNMVVAIYGRDGTLQWAQCVAQGTGSITANAVAFDASGNVVVIGEFAGTVQFGSQTVSSAGSTDVFVAKYAATGALLWVRRAGGSTGDKGYGVAVDAQGAIVTTGGYQNPDTIFVTKYTPTGTVQWSRHLTGQGANSGRAVALDGQANIVVTGAFYGTIQLDASTVSLTSASSWYPDVVLAKFTAAGTLLWARAIGGVGDERSYGLAVDQLTGASVLTGTFYGTADFGQGAVASTGYDIFLAKYDAAGRPLWVKVFPGPGNDVGYAVAMDQQNGDIVMTGAFDGTQAFGGPTVSSVGSTDIVIARYVGDTGAHVWSRAFGGPYADLAPGLAVDAAGSVYATGTFVQRIDFGGVC